MLEMACSQTEINLKYLMYMYLFITFFPLTGTYQPNPGQLTCEPCPSGFHCMSNTTIPEPCPAYSYCPNGTADPYLCPNGTYTTSAETGLEADTDCHACPAGKDKQTAIIR